MTGPCGFSLRATRRTIKSEDYALTSPLFFYLPARRLPAMAREFLAYTRSAPAQIASTMSFTVASRFLPVSLMRVRGRVATPNRR